MTTSDHRASPAFADSSPLSCSRPHPASFWHRTSQAAVAAVIGLAVLALAACVAHSGGPTARKDVIGQWIVEDIDHAGAIDRARLTLSFGPDGTVSGVAGCNRYTGSYRREGHALSFTGLVSTQMACVSAALMKQEARMLASLQSVTGLGWTVDGALVLSGPAPHSLTLREDTTLAAPASAAAGGRGITPIPASYRCGDETFKVAFEHGMAYVSLADGTMVMLPRLIKPGGEDPEEPRLYTDGRLSFIPEIEGGRAVRFARGRMARIACERVPG
jgi:heat shock protein HslJ